MTLFPIDGVLLELRNQKERCVSSSVATTSHVLMLSILFFQDSTSTSMILFVPSFGYTTWLCLCVSNFDQIHSLLLVIIKLCPKHFIRDFAIALPHHKC
jgi:hypothetical protein